MRQHLEIVAWLNLGLGVLGLLVGLMLFGIVGTVGVLSEEAEARTVLALVATAIAAVAMLLSVPGIVGGWGLLQRKPWSRVLVLILSFLNLFNVPFGTLLGAYGIWVLMHEETRAILEGRHPTAER